MARANDPIIINAFNQGGVADSKYSGIKNSMARMVGFNIHGNPGVLQVNQRMTKISSTGLADEFCKARVDASNGIKYFFSSTSGKIWQLKNGTITLVYIIVPTSGSAAILDAYEYQDTIYFATQNYLHKIATANADGASNWSTNVTANWQAFTNGDTEYHPMKEVNLVLFIGDGNLVAQVDSGVFSAAALDVESQYRVSALGKMNTDLLVGTIISSNVNQCEIFQWNTYGFSFTNSDTIFEAGINAFLEADNYVIVNAGTAMNLYSYNGQYAQYFKKIPGTYSPTKQAKINYRAVALLNGFLPLFGVSNVQGNPCDQGIWSMGKYAAGYPTVINLEFPIPDVDVNSLPVTSGVEIGFILVSGQDVYMSYRYNSDSGIAKLDYSSKIQKPFFETRVASPIAAGFTTFDKFTATYEEALPTGTSIAFKYGKNGEDPSTNTDIEVTNNSDKAQVEADGSRLDARTIQLRGEITTSGNNAPVIQEVIMQPL